MKTVYVILFLALFSPAAAQRESKFAIEVNYGLNGNFFVRNYYEGFLPFQEILFLKKNFIGTTGGIEFKYKAGQKSRIGVAYARSTNKSSKNFNGNIDGVDVVIDEFSLKHNTDYIQFYYERDLSKDNSLVDYQIGLFIMNGFYQELALAEGNGFGNGFVRIIQRNRKNYGMQEGGVFSAIQLSKKIDTKFIIGLKLKIFYLLSAPGIEEISLTPTLTYRF